MYPKYTDKQVLDFKLPLSHSSLQISPLIINQHGLNRSITKGAIEDLVNEQHLASLDTAFAPPKLASDPTKLHPIQFINCSKLRIMCTPFTFAMTNLLLLRARTITWVFHFPSAVILLSIPALLKHLLSMMIKVLNRTILKCILPYGLIAALLVLVLFICPVVLLSFQVMVLHKTHTLLTLMKFQKKAGILLWG